jgi:hypothetical protein
LDSERKEAADAAIWYKKAAAPAVGAARNFQIETLPRKFWYLSGYSSIINKMNRRINNIRRDISWQVMRDGSQFSNAKGCRILVYHGVCLNDHLRFNTLFVNLADFERQLRFYKKYFNIVSLDDFYAERFDPGRFTICLTFDDGFANNYRYVLPLLEKYEAPAAFFVTAIRDAGYDILWNDFLSIASRYGPSRLYFRNDRYSKNRTGRYVSDTNGKALADILRAGDFAMKDEMMETFPFLNKFKNNENEYD